MQKGSNDSQSGNKESVIKKKGDGLGGRRGKKYRRGKGKRRGKRKRRRLA
jgi:hypothetical protein